MPECNLKQSFGSPPRSFYLDLKKGEIESIRGLLNERLINSKGLEVSCQDCTIRGNETTILTLGGYAQGKIFYKRATGVSSWEICADIVLIDEKRYPEMMKIVGCLGTIINSNGRGNNHS